MSKSPRGSELRRQDLAEVLEGLAERISRRDMSYDVQGQVLAAMSALVELRHIEGVLLLNRLSFLLLTDGGGGVMKYEYARKWAQQLAPLDPAKEAAALRQLAAELRTG
jgi:hypothetical protein